MKQQIVAEQTPVSLHVLNMQFWCILTYSDPNGESYPGQGAELHHEEHINEDAGSWNQRNQRYLFNNESYII